jgi:hypothetical protein
MRLASLSCAHKRRENVTQKYLDSLLGDKLIHGAARAKA